MKPFSHRESPLWPLFVRLRHRRFLIGTEDYRDLRQALRAGYGLSSKESLRNLCCTLWAKSKYEREIVGSLFDQLELPDWDLKNQAPENMLSSTEELDDAVAASVTLEDEAPLPPLSKSRVDIQLSIPATLPSRGLPAITVDEVLLPTKSFIFVPHFSLTSREAAKLGGCLRKTDTSDLLEDIDVNATIDLRCRQGILGSIILKSRKRNTRVLILMDRQGSMAPFHQACEMLCESIAKSDSVSKVAVYYFHDVIAEGPDHRDLLSRKQELFPVLDDLWDQIDLSKDGYIFEDRELLLPVLVQKVLRSVASDSIVIFLSDAGAARRHYEPQRLCDTVGFIKSLRLQTDRYIWFNPLPQISWIGTTAAEIARCIPMFPIDVQGLNEAASNLRR